MLIRKRKRCENGHVFGGGFLDIVLPPKHKFVKFVTREIDMSALKGHTLGSYV